MRMYLFHMENDIYQIAAYSIEQTRILPKLDYLYCKYMLIFRLKKKKILQIGSKESKRSFRSTSEETDENYVR